PFLERRGRGIPGNGNQYHGACSPGSGSGRPGRGVAGAGREKVGGVGRRLRRLLEAVTAFFVCVRADSWQAGSTFVVSSEKQAKWKYSLDICKGVNYNDAKVDLPQPEGASRKNNWEGEEMKKGLRLLTFCM